MKDTDDSIEIRSHDYQKRYSFLIKEILLPDFILPDEIIKKRPQLSLNSLKVTDGVIIVRSHNFDKTFSMPFSKRFGCHI